MAPRHNASNSSHMSAIVQPPFDAYIIPNWKLHLAGGCVNQFSGYLNVETKIRDNWSFSVETVCCASLILLLCRFDT